MSREPKLTIAPGERGIGKTHTTTQIMYKIANGNREKGIMPRKVLIFDIQNEFSKIKTLPLAYVPMYAIHPTVDIRRISVFKDSGRPMNSSEMMKALMHITSNYSNGFLLIEDMNKYISDSFPKDLVGSIISLRHVGVDVYMHVQSKTKTAHPKLYPNTNYIRLHKTGDFFADNPSFSKYVADAELLTIAELLVEQENAKRPKDQQYFYLYINKDYKEIEGQFTKAQFIQALETYISINESKIINPLLRRNNRKGEKIYQNHEQAYNFILDKLFTEYYGNG